MKPEIILLGGGGHCRSCIDVIEQAGDFNIAGIVDKNLSTPGLCIVCNRTLPIMPTTSSIKCANGETLSLFS